MLSSSKLSTVADLSPNVMMQYVKLNYIFFSFSFEPQYMSIVNVMKDNHSRKFGETSNIYNLILSGNLKAFKC